MNRGRGRSRGGGGVGRGAGNRGKGRGRKVQAPLNFDVPEGGMTVYDRPSLGGDVEEPVGNGWGVTVVSKPPTALRNKAWASIASETSEAESTYGRDWMAREDQARQAPVVVSRAEVPSLSFPSRASHHAEQPGSASQDFPPLGNAANSQLPNSDAALHMQDYFPGLPASIGFIAPGNASSNGNVRKGGVEGGDVNHESGPSAAPSEASHSEQLPTGPSDSSIAEKKGKMAASIQEDSDQGSMCSTMSYGTDIPKFRTNGIYDPGECSGDAQGWERDRSDTDEITSVTDSEFPALGPVGQWKSKETRRHGKWLAEVTPIHAPPSVDSRSQAGDSTDTGCIPISCAAGLAQRMAEGGDSSGSELSWHDDGSEFDDDSDEDGVPNGVQGKRLTFNHSKEVLDFLDDITKEQPARLTSKTEEWKCKVCFGGPGSGDWYPGLQSLVAHAKTIQSRRPTAHREFLNELRRRLEARDIVIPNLTTPKVTGMWTAPAESYVQDMEKTIMWPPIVMVVNTRLEKQNDMWAGMSRSELEKQFSGYKTVMRGDHAYGPEGHQGESLLIFKETAEGFREAEALHKEFNSNGRGRSEWVRACGTRTGKGNDLRMDHKGQRLLFGYLATKEDLDSFNRHRTKKGQKVTFTWKKLRDVYDEPEKRLEQTRQEKAMASHKLNRVVEENTDLRVEKKNLEEDTLNKKRAFEAALQQERQATHAAQAKVQYSAGQVTMLQGMVKRVEGEKRRLINIADEKYNDLEKKVGDLEKRLRATKMRSVDVVDGAKQGMRRRNDEIVVDWDEAKAGDGKGKVKADEKDWWRKGGRSEEDKKATAQKVEQLLQVTIDMEESMTKLREEHSERLLAIKMQEAQEEEDFLLQCEEVAERFQNKHRSLTEGGGGSGGECGFEDGGSGEGSWRQQGSSGTSPAVSDWETRPSKKKAGKEKGGRGGGRGGAESGGTYHQPWDQPRPFK